MPQFRAGQRLTADALNALAPNPIRSDATADPDFLTTGVFVDFPEADFPRIEIDVPDGARLRVITAARLFNKNSLASTCYLSWRAEGANTIADQFIAGLGSGGEGLTRASNVHLTGALNGGVTTLVPQWRISSGSALTAELNQASITVEIVP